MKLQLPLKGLGTNPAIHLSQRFGENPTAYAQFGIKGHNGIDWAAPLDTPVYAIADGYVMEVVNKTTGFGLRVSQYFEADGKQYVAIYAHFHRTVYTDISWNYKLRQYPVKKGQVIGYVDSTGFSTGNHLHLSLYEYIDGFKLNGGNGYEGAFDPAPYFDSIIKNTGKETYFMDNEFVKTINIKGAVGLVILADTAENLMFLGKAYGKAITINPDGTIPTDYTIN